MARSDVELVLAMTRGDQSALGELYERHVGRLTFLIQAILGEPALAADVAQDVFLEAWRNATHFDPQRGSVRAWLAVRARSRALDQLRKRARRSHLESEERIEPAARIPQRESVSLPRALRQVSPEEREVLFLGYFEELTSSEIADRLGIPVGTVKSRTRSALQKLATFYQEQDS